VNVHKNARLTPAGRALLVERVLECREGVPHVATALGVGRRTAWSLPCPVRVRVTLSLSAARSNVRMEIPTGRSLLPAR
jgi:hypothetical protein